MPRSRSRVMAKPVIMTMVIVSTTPISPGTMLYWVMASGLYVRMDAQVDGAVACPPDRPADLSNHVAAPCRWSPRSEPIALLVAAGSVASASTAAPAGRHAAGRG